ncbi:MAG TPA: YkgJ family cysteine cluster protein [Sedimentisphaerales bacterium]|jgi:Fe-S-cluster containining protein|nr:YkgJ family cysteine cluster protein [Sedimentisphaerales bacterium]HNU30818.1 YkgJ family cysteine cluster protein [Sedimentisphaerales bacterium]
MVGLSEGHRRLVEEVANVYARIESQQQRERYRAGSCNACGACCDFIAYEHRLYVTPPELIYLAAKLNADRLLPMPTGRCPYQQDNRCTIHEHRFAGCRIFTCRGDSAFQSDLSEAALKRLKQLCEDLRVPYRYQDLPTALNTFVIRSYGFGPDRGATPSSSTA